MKVATEPPAGWNGQNWNLTAEESAIVTTYRIIFEAGSGFTISASSDTGAQRRANLIIAKMRQLLEKEGATIVALEDFPVDPEYAD